MKAKLIIGLSIILGASFASADDIQFQHTGAGQNVNITFHNQAMRVFAGKLQFLDKVTATTFESVCVDLEHSIRSGQTYEVTRKFSHQDTNAMLKAGNIVADGFHTANSNTSAAALQLAVWEAITDGGSTANFTSGGFKASNVSGSVIDQAKMYYAKMNVPGVATLFKAKTIDCVPGQSQMTACVPEPASLTALVLGAAGFIRRRRNAKK